MQTTRSSPLPMTNKISHSTDHWCLSIYEIGSSAFVDVSRRGAFGFLPVASMVIEADGRIIMRRFSTTPVVLVDLSKEGSANV